MDLNEILNNLERGGADITALKSYLTQLGNAHKAELDKAKSTNSNAELNALKGELNAIKAEFGLSGDNPALSQLKELIESKGKSDSAKLNALEVKIAELTSTINAEKASKLELLKKSALNECVNSISNLNPLFREDVELRLANAIKIDESGAAYFDINGTAMSKESFINDFIGKNQKYLNPLGQAGAGASGSYDNASANITKEQFSAMSATDRLMLFKQNPNLYKELDHE